MWKNKALAVGPTGLCLYFPPLPQLGLVPFRYKSALPGLARDYRLHATICGQDDAKFAQTAVKIYARWVWLDQGISLHPTKIWVPLSTVVCGNRRPYTFVVRGHRGGKSWQRGKFRKKMRRVYPLCCVPFINLNCWNQFVFDIIGYNILGIRG